MTKFAGVALAALFSAGTAFGALQIKDGETVAFLGDSITQLGQDKRRPNGYVNLVLRALAEKGVRVKAVRAGISGHKSDNMLARLDRDVLSKKPQWMTLSCGVNDVWHQDFGKGISLETYKTNITTILDKCAAANCKVILLTATIFEKEKETDGKNAKLAPYNAWLCEEAARRGLPLADLNARMWEARRTNPRVRLTSDGVHMATAGNRLMAKGVLEAIGFDPADYPQIEREAWKDVWVLCRFDLKSVADRATYIAKTKEILAKVRAEPGCLEYRLVGDAVTDWEKPQRSGEKVLWMIEHWDSIQSLKAHLETPHMKAFGPVAQPLRSSGTFQVFEDVLP